MSNRSGLMRVALAAAAFAAVLGAGGAALGWGATGHRLIGMAAIQGLPDSLPDFVRSPQAAADVGELAREPDRWKDAGKVHDNLRDPAHFVDLDDGGKVLGGPALTALPPTKTDYDTALRAVGADSAKAGWLPYAIVDGWEQLAKDFAEWRADVAGLKFDKDAAHRVWLARDKTRREALTLRDLGTLGHYVGDGSQPLHVTVHYNGWGPGPNPEGFTLQRIHASFEGPFIRDHVTLEAVRAAMTPPEDCHCPMMARASAYLAKTNSQVVPLYRLEKAGGFSGSDPDGVAFATRQVAAGASELRDLVVAAWGASTEESVGYPVTPLADVEAGRVEAYGILYGQD
jgi:hypothetical protein